MPACLRCGIDIPTASACCRDCISVDRRRCDQLRDHALDRAARQAAAWDWLDGITKVGASRAAAERRR